MPPIGLLGFAVGIWVASWIFAWLRRAGRGSVPILAVFQAWFDSATTAPLRPEVLPGGMGAATPLAGLGLLPLLPKAPGTPHPAGRPADPRNAAPPARGPASRRG